MRSVGEPFPTFSLQAVVSTEPGREFQTIDQSAYPGKWKVVFYWPMDFTFVCPTEIAEFGERNADFAKRGAQVLGVSTDTHYVHLAWRIHEPSLKDLPFPMLADTKRELANALGVIHPAEGVIRHVTVNDLSVGRNVDETLRVIDALQTGGLTPCNWKAGDPTLRVA